MISSASMWNMDGMAVMGICEDAYQKLLCHRTREMLNCANVSQLSSVQQDAGLRAKRAVGCLQRMRNDRDYSMTEKMPLEASNIA